MADNGKDPLCSTTACGVNANARSRGQPTAQLKGTLGRLGGQKAAPGSCRHGMAGSADGELGILARQQPKLNTARLGHMHPSNGSSKSKDSHAIAARDNMPLRLEPSALTQCESDRLGARRPAAHINEPVCDSGQALFGIFGSIQTQQPGLSKESMPQIDDDEIQKEVQQKLMRHRRKRMRRMRCNQG